MGKAVLIVGGTFDRFGGKKSGLIEKIYQSIDYKKFDYDIVACRNGGNVEDLNEELEFTKEFDIVLWMPNVSNDEVKIRNVKEVNPKTILISSKRNDNNKYNFAELISRALELKSNLTIEFSKVEENNCFNMRVFDPLGNQFYNGTDVETMVNKLFKRAGELAEFTRKPTIPVNSNDRIPEVPDEEEFFAFARNCSDIFHNLINPAAGTTRFLGNMSFRCQNGFPSFRGEDGLIFVSRRNVDKRQITKESFVPTYLDEDENVRYYGDAKPSVDTPVQLRLYKKFPQMNYMIHAHCYANTILLTEHPVPCGAIEEVDEIESVVKNSMDAEFIAINLIGHGCILMTKDVKYFTRLMKYKKYKDNCFVKRNIPEVFF